MKTLKLLPVAALIILLTALVAKSFETDPIFPLEVRGLRYPPLALQAGIQGFVIVKCDLSRTKASKCVAEGDYSPLAEAAIQNASSWTFDNTQNSAGVRIEYEFKLKGVARRAAPAQDFVWKSPNRVEVTSEALGQVSQ